MEVGGMNNTFLSLIQHTSVTDPHSKKNHKIDRKMFRFFTATSDDILLLPSMISVILSFGILVVQQFAQSERIKTPDSFYFLSCFTVLCITTFCALFTDRRRLNPIRNKQKDTSNGVVCSGRFFASFPVGLLFAGEALYLAVIQNQNKGSSRYDKKLLCFTISPILLCLLSTTAAVICLWGCKESSFTEDSKKLDRKEYNERQSTSEAPLLEEWRVQQRSTLIASFLVSLIFPFLKLFPNPYGTATLSVIPLASSSQEYLLHVFLFACFFFFVFGTVARTIIRTTNSETIALSLVAALLIGPSCYNSLILYCPHRFIFPIFDHHILNDEASQSKAILSVLGVFFFIFFLISTMCSNLRRRYIGTTVRSSHIHTSTLSIPRGQSIVAKHLPIPPSTPLFIQLIHLTASIVLLGAFLYWFFVLTFPYINTTPFLWLCQFIGFYRMPESKSQASSRLTIIFLWLIGAPIVVLGIHVISSPLTMQFNQTNKIKVMDPSIHLLKVLARKMYHVGCVLAFFPVLIFWGDAIMLSCALIVAFGILVVIEIIRATGLPFQRSSIFVNRFIERYLDGRDHRGIVVTHLYLLLGIGFPIVYETFMADFHGRPIDLLAAAQGLLAVGIGDTSAALIGVWLSGKGVAHPLPLPGLPRKTWEGLIAFCLSYFGSSVCLLLWSRRSLSIRRLVALGLTSCVSGIFEATTEEIDNFLLPLFSLTTYRSLQASAQILLPLTQ